MFKRVLRLNVCLVVLLAIGGCYLGSRAPAKPVTSQVPVPSAFRLSTQQKMQAVHHWKLLAQDVAHLIGEKIDGGYHDPLIPIYVAPSGITPFEKAFHDLLLTSLVEIGLDVSNRPEGNRQLSFDIQVITHHQKILRSGGVVYEPLAPGVFVQRGAPSLYGPDKMNNEGETLEENAELKAEAEVIEHRAELNAEAGEYAVELPKNEIIVTTSLIFSGKYIMRNSSIYYINDPDWSQYVLKSRYKDPAVAQYMIVDK
jgi:hypothetical protein